MNKNEFLNNLSFITGHSKQTCKDIIDSFYYLICDSLKKGEEVCFKGLGKFYVKSKNERIIKNNLGVYLVGPKKIVSFKIGKTFKNIIN
ncbi:MAG: HU family DNA-binding protein [Clostridia bacterium]|nr:HU family DNA-binding protein [Clostridia bacterium]